MITTAEELMEALERKHEKEKEDLKRETVAMLKASKKNTRPQIEAKVMIFRLTNAHASAGDSNGI
jgi:ATP-dependent protease HslVU (ClpYQ) peptidase subunit